MLGDQKDTPIMSQTDYRRTMCKISNQYDLLKETPWLGTNYVQGLMQNLNPTVNNGGSQGLFGGLETIINNNK